MVQDTQTLCRRHGLTYVESSELGLRRRRCGKGFSYLDPSGRTVRDKAVRAWIKALAIPPAWTDVCIAQDDRAHIQAIGRDAEGRLQYRYHPDWEHVRSSGKERRLLRFGSALPRVRSAVKAALAGSSVTRTKVIAAVVRLIDVALLRPGYDEYAREHGGRGAATLLKKDVAVEGDKIVVEFKGKGGKQIKQEVEDRSLARVVRKLTPRASVVQCARWEWNQAANYSAGRELIHCASRRERDLGQGLSDLSSFGRRTGFPNETQWT